ncbi:MAG TPA: glycosyltransferase family 2 protein [Acidimicrobiales bacterium]|nr:glycosyltransferase family 2 protein [Acidimicrobiales bacterium]
MATEPNPVDPNPLTDFRFFAVLGTWMEEDVVEATVRNAFAQGVEAVYLVDNASTDATVERALAAGATLAETFATRVYEEHVRVLFMNGVVARESLACGAEHVWWLWLDADEFPEGPDGMTIAEYLRTLDRRFRLVGSTYYNHYPSGKPEYLPGFHPLEFQPLCEHYVRVLPRFCDQWHFKHPLQRFDDVGPFVMSIIGFHSANTMHPAPLLEPTGGIVTHHVQYRDEAFTRMRMEMLCGGAGRNSYNHSIGNTEIGKRFASLDAIYGQRWRDVDNLRIRDTNKGVDPEPWTGPPLTHLWYQPEELEAARRAWLDHRSLSHTE